MKPYFVRQIQTKGRTAQSRAGRYESMSEFVVKRRSPRRLLKRKVGALYHGKFYVTDSVEVGEGGIMVFSSTKFEVGQMIVVTFAVPGKDLVPVRGEVRYEVDVEGSDEKAYGIQFTNLDLAYRRLVRRYVAEKTELEAEQEKNKLRKPKTYAFSFGDDGKPKATAL